MGKDVKLNFALYWNGAERVRRGTAKQSRKREIRPEQESGAALTGSFWSVSRFRSFSRFRSSFGPDFARRPKALRSSHA